MAEMNRIFLALLALIIFASCSSPKTRKEQDPLASINLLIKDFESTKESGDENELDRAVIAYNLYKMSAHKFKNSCDTCSGRTLIKLLSDRSGESLRGYFLRRIGFHLDTTNHELRSQIETIYSDIMKDKLFNQNIRYVAGETKFSNSLISLAYLQVLLLYENRIGNTVDANLLDYAIFNVANSAHDLSIKNFFGTLLQDQKKKTELLNIDIFVSSEKLFKEAIYHKGLAVKNIGISVEEQISLYFKSLICFICLTEVHRHDEQLLDKTTAELKSLLTIINGIDKQN